MFCFVLFFTAFWKRHYVLFKFKILLLFSAIIKIIFVLSSLQMNPADPAVKCWPPPTTLRDNFRWTYELLGVRWRFWLPRMETLTKYTSGVLSLRRWWTHTITMLSYETNNAITDGLREHFFSLGGNSRGGNESHVVDAYVVTRKPNHHPLGYP